MRAAKGEGKGRDGGAHAPHAAVRARGAARAVPGGVRAGRGHLPAAGRAAAGCGAAEGGSVGAARRGGARRGEGAATWEEGVGPARAPVAGAALRVFPARCSTSFPEKLGMLLPGSVQQQVGWGSEGPGLVSLPMSGGLELDDPIPPKPFL